MYVSEDKKEALVTYVVIRCGVYNRHYLRLEGLDADTRYLNKQTGQILTGKAWMNAGICIQETPKDFESKIYHLIALT